MSKATRRAPSTSVLLLGAGLVPFAASAATIKVVSPNDTSVSGSLTCTLRQAIVTMNTGAAVGHCTAAKGAIGDHNNDTVVFAAGAGSTIALADSDTTFSSLVVTDPALTIDASAIAGGVAITRPATSTRYFSIFYDTAPAGSSLKLVGLTISNGHSVGGCDIYGDAQGGGICALGANLTLDNCTVKGNVATWGGGIFAKSGNIILTNSTVSGNRAYKGAGVYAKTGNVTLTGSTISNNKATAGNAANPVVGGGIYSVGGATVMVAASTISGNTSSGRGGGIAAQTAAITLTRSVVDDNIANNGDGGGILSYGPSLTVAYSTVSNNEATNGSCGGIRGSGAVALSSTAVSGNHASDSGGGIETYGASLAITNSTISGNYANYGGAIASGSAAITLNNSTIAINSTGSSLMRGALTIVPGFSGSHTVTFNNTLFWGNGYDVATNVAGSSLPVHGNRNVVQSTAKTFTPVVFDNAPLSGDPNLGPLTTNGGPTRTMALEAGSFALDAGDASLVPGVAHDQRGTGYARVSGSAQDIGAYEHQIDEIFYNGFD